MAAEPCPGEYRRVWELDESADESGWIRVPDLCDVVTDLWLETDDNDGSGNDERLDMFGIRLAFGDKNVYYYFHRDLLRMLEPSADRGIHVPLPFRFSLLKSPTGLKFEWKYDRHPPRLVALRGIVSDEPSLPDIGVFIGYGEEPLVPGRTLHRFVAPDFRTRDTFLFALKNDQSGELLGDPRVVRWTVEEEGVAVIEVICPIHDPHTNAYRVQLEDPVNPSMCIELDRPADPNTVFVVFRANRKYQ